jgi:Leucine-rich repeat (LRR) protein
VYLTASVNGTTVSGANIYYTLNGSTPSTSSTKYTSSGITITQSCTLKAIAYKDGYETSQVLTASYTVESTPYITLVSAICDNTNLDNLSQNDKLVFRATWKNIGKTDNITTILGLKKEGTNTLLYMSPQVTKSFQKDKEVICTYELSLSNVAEGKYLANVYYYKHWDGKLWWSWDNRAKIIWVNSAPIDEGVKINATNFPDENFRNYLLSQDYGKDGSLTEEEIKNITFLNVSWKSISNLKGIEYFTALKELDCYNNQLTSLDVSKNTALTWLGCFNNQLTSLDVSKNTALTKLWCNNIYQGISNGCTGKQHE